MRANVPFVISLADKQSFCVVCVVRGRETVLSVANNFKHVDRRSRFVWIDIRGLG